MGGFLSVGAADAAFLWSDQRETQGKVTEKPRDGVRVAALSEMQSRGGQLSSQ